MAFEITIVFVSMGGSVWRLEVEYVCCISFVLGVYRKNDDCTPSCLERETTYYESDVPCDTDDGDDNTIEVSCTVVEECGKTIYCRAEGV